MEFVRVQSIEDKYFKGMHQLLSKIFPPEEVLAFELWKEPIQDPDIHVYVAVLNGEVVGATEYRYYSALRVAMTDFTIIGAMGLGVGRFLYAQREKDLHRLQQESGSESVGMFAEIYNPQSITGFSFGDVPAMHPVVRREVLSHIGYSKLDLQYVHPSWDHEGKAVTELDLGFRPTDEDAESIPASLVAKFLRQYYAALSNKPKEWTEMVTELENRDEVALLPL